MRKYYNHHLKTLAKTLRKKMTETEVRLWMRIRKKQINNLQFYRQKPLGKYIVDFYCPRKKLVLEVDGSQHLEKENEKKDMERDYFLKDKLGLNVLRFNNLDILNNMEGVIEKIFTVTK